MKNLPRRIVGHTPAGTPPTVLIVLSHAPFDGDTTWNALRLASTLLDRNSPVRIFVMNDAIDVVRQGAMPEDMFEVTLATAGQPMAIAQLLKACGLTPSTSEALRMIEQGGVRIDGERVTDRALQIDPGRTLVLQVGKRKFARVTLR